MEINLLVKATYLELQRAIRQNLALNTVRSKFGAFKKLVFSLDVTEEELLQIGRDYSRPALQDVACYLIGKQHNVLLDLATGAGKTKPVLDFIHNTPNAKVLVLHFLANHRVNLQKEIEKWGTHGDITFSTYRGSRKLVSTEWDIVVMDEAHHVTERNAPHLETIRAKYCISLSATMPSTKRLLLQTISKAITSHKIHTLKLPLIESIKFGILPSPIIYVMYLSMDNTQRNQQYYKHKGKDLETVEVDKPQLMWDYIKEKVNLNILCTQKEYYELLMKDLEYWKDRFITRKEAWTAGKWRSLGSLRYDWIARQKRMVIKKLCTRMRYKRLLVFANSIGDAEDFSEGRACVHNNNSTKVNASLIEQFNDGDIDHLYSVNMLNESWNLENIEFTVIQNLNTHKLTYIVNVQRMGRTMRASRPKIIIPILKGTTDEANFKDFVQDLDVRKFVKSIPLSALDRPPKQ